MIAQKGWVDLEGEWPRLAAWRKRILERDAWKRGMEKGNGYDLRF
jgi:glutathione S-transferase